MVTTQFSKNQLGLQPRGDGPATALVDPSDAHTVPGIVDVETGPDHSFWVIETGGFDAVWPANFSIESTVNPYCLVGEHDASIFVQGPAHIADPDVLIAPGQTVIARRKMGRDVQVLELAYEHDGEAWWQGIYLYPRKGGRVLVFTAQSREPGVAAARHGVEWMLGLIFRRHALHRQDSALITLHGLPLSARYVEVSVRSCRREGTRSW